MKLDDRQGRPLENDAMASVSRRTFLRWSSSCAVGVGPLGASIGLAACGGGDSSSDPASAPAAPAPGPTILENPATASISIQARQVQWVVGKSPADANAWVYVADATVPASGVLGNPLGPFFNVRRDSACTVTWTNTIGASTLFPARLADPPINVPLDLGMCGRVINQSPVGLSTHLHGARVQAGADGWPLTPVGFAGNPYGFPQSRQDLYPNAQRSAMLWYHDHGMDRVGRHVHAGLSGPYCIRDAADDAILALIGGRSQELLFAIADRILTADQTAIDYDAGIPHDFSLSNIGSDDAVGRPEFLGDQIFVNGHPTSDVTLARGAWRLRVLDLSNARTYALALCDPDAIAAKTGRVWYTQCMRLIGGDGGLIGTSVAMQDTDALVIAPAQRRDVIVDLSAVPASVTRLRLVNVSLRYLLAVDAITLEAIYTTYDDSVLAPTNAQFDDADQVLYDALDGPLAILAGVNLGPEPAAGGAALPVPSATAIDGVLVGAADEDDFVWDGAQMGRVPGTALGANRLVLLVSNTERLEVGTAVNGVTGWSDVQIFEMQAGGSDWFVPFAVDLATTAEPAAGEPAASAQGYHLARRSFFAQELNADITLAKVYPALHAPTISAKSGTYERWYVGNLNNSQPLDAAAGAPDMHPFHIHLVNFVVLRRWQLDDSGAFTPVAPSDLGLDRIARQDTVAIPSNQLVELLVHYPLGYTGDFAYHCHILEHEDNCMMSHFHVDA
jgi:FtsP/CotA-like multicopper oxidase with cupredoxin domain